MHAKACICYFDIPYIKLIIILSYLILSYLIIMLIHIIKYMDFGRCVSLSSVVYNFFFLLVAIDRKCHIEEFNLRYPKNINI